MADILTCENDIRNPLKTQIRISFFFCSITLQIILKGKLSVRKCREMGFKLFLCVNHKQRKINWLLIDDRLFLLLLICFVRWNSLSIPTK